MIVFRCNANNEVGFGHLMRCRQLARELKRRGHKVSIFGVAEKEKSSIDKEIFDHWRSSLEWQDSITDASNLLSFGAKVGVSAYVLDDFRVDEKYQLILRDAGIPFALFQGRADQKIWADLLYCANAASDTLNFNRLIKKSECVRLIGMRYALLGHQFVNLRHKPINDKVSRIFLTFGGGSDRGAFQFVLNVLLRSHPNKTFCIVSGSNNPSNSHLGKLAKKHPNNIQLNIGATNVAELMNACDLAVMAGGTSCLEATSVRLPMLLIAISDNQIVPATALDALGGAVYLGELKNLSPHILKGAFNYLLPRFRRIQMANTLKSAGVDGKGSIIFVDALEKIIFPQKAS